MLTALYAVGYLAGCFALGVATALALPSPAALLVFGALLAWWYALGTGALLDWWLARQCAAASALARGVAGEDAPFFAREAGRIHRSGGPEGKDTSQNAEGLLAHPGAKKPQAPREGLSCN